MTKAKIPAPISVKLAVWETDQKVLRKIREQVFVDEQGVSVEEEWDGKDELETTEHFVATIDDEDQTVIGYARLEGSGKIGRMAVLTPYRQRGAGSMLLSFILKRAHSHDLDVFLYAQVHAKPFYKKHGFSETGELFDDAGIPHVKMLGPRSGLKK